jgi:Tol biopolymer transport system component
VRVVDGIRGGNGPFGTFAISDSGTLAYVPGGSAFSSSRTFVWVDRQGVEQPTASPTRQYNYPRLSPDGQFVAVEIQGGDSADIWVYDLARNNLSRITSEGFNVGPQWTPDGKRLIYASVPAFPV